MARPVKAYLTLAAGFLWMLMVGSIYSTGSIVPYIVSYFGKTSKQAQYVLPSNAVLTCFAMVIGGQLAQKMFNPKLLLVICAMILSGCIFASSFVNDFYAWFILYICAYSFGSGFAYITLIQQAWLWYPDQPGLFSGAIISGMGLSALIFNNVAFLLVNPHNLKQQPDGFFPPEVNEKVPFMIRVLSAIYLSMGLTAAFIFFPGPKPTVVSADYSVDDQINITAENQIDDSKNQNLLVNEETEKKEKIMFKQALKSKQYWVLYLMACLSILFGYYTLDVYKTFGEEKKLAGDLFLTEVGSVSAIFGFLRFVWSGFLDKYSFKQVYGVLICCQIFLASTMVLAASNKWWYALWVCLSVWCEAGHFTIFPNVLKKIYGDIAASLYGVFMSFTGALSLLMIGLLASRLGTMYVWFFEICAIFNVISLAILIFVFDETKFDYEEQTKKIEE